MELLSPERLREMTFLQSKKGGLPGSEGESSSIYRHQETRLEGGVFPPRALFAAPPFIKQMFILSYASRYFMIY